MHAARTALLGVVAASLLIAASSVAVQASGCAGDKAPMVVSGQVSALINVDPGTTEWLPPLVEDGRRREAVEMVRRQVWRYLLSVDDSRLSGEMTMTWNWDDYDVVTDTSVAWGTLRIKNDMGVWAGTFTGAEFPGGLMDSHAWLSGSGAYEGMGVFLCLQCPTHGPALPYQEDMPHTWGASGLIFTGDVPDVAQHIAAVQLSGTR